MKLIKIDTDHYVVVDDSEIKEDCWALHVDPLGGKEIVTANGQCKLDKKITHSSQPLEYIEHKDEFGTHKVQGFDKIQYLSLQEVKELIELDVDKKAENYGLMGKLAQTSFREYKLEEIAYKNGYNQALEDNKEKKYTEEDMIGFFDWSLGINVVEMLCNNMPKKEIFQKYIQSLQPKTSWEIEMIDGKIKLK